MNIIRFLKSSFEDSAKICQSDVEVNTHKYVFNVFLPQKVANKDPTIYTLSNF